jgi:hypothetical protein
MINRLASLYNNLVLGRPVFILLLLACVFLFFSFHARDFDLDASADSLLLENDQDLRLYREMTDRYETREFLFVAYVPDRDLFSDQSIATVTALRDEFSRLEMVESVVSLVDVPLVKLTDGKLSDVANNYRTLAEPGVDRGKARAELLNSPLFNELIISKDGTTTAMMVTLRQNESHHRLTRRKNGLSLKKYETGLTPDEQRELEQVTAEYNASKEVVDAATHRVIGESRQIMSRYQDTGELHLGGVPMIADDMITFIKHDLVLFGSGIFVFLVLMLSIIFRQLRWVILPLMSCIFAGLVMTGVLGLAGWRVTVISSNFISLMLILTMSMNVHLIVRYRQLCRDYPDLAQRDLVLETAKKMVWPCLYTALTTMIGFGSLVVSGIKPVIDFGWMMTLGLSVTFFTSFLLFPVVLTMIGKSAGNGTQQSAVPFTAALATITEKHGNKVLLISLMLAVISIAGITRLKVENSFVNYFSDSTEIYQGLKLIDDKLGGTTTLDIVLKFDDPQTGTDEDEEIDDFDAMFGEIEVDKADYWFTPEKIDLIKAIHDYLEAIPAVGKVRSLASTVRVAEDLASGQEFNTFEMAIIYKRLPQALREEMITPYVSIEDDEARINLRVKDSRKDLRRKELLEKIRADLVNEFGIAGENLQMTGLLVLYNNMLQSLFQSQIKTLGVVMLGIALMLLVLFRSFSLAVIGILPNILAAAIILGLMGLSGIPLDMMTITIAAITIGIAVDNSIHYIYRFREEFSRNNDYLQTLHYCHASIGRAVFYTAITIIVGFSILVLSNFIPTIYFGLLTALAMFIALLAALTLLPKLILLWKPFSR